MTEEKSIKKSRTNWIMLLLNAAAILSMLVSYGAVHIAPASYGYFSLFGLAYPFILIANLLFITYWLFKKKKYAWFSTAVILIGFTHIADFFQLSVQDELQGDEKLVKVLTYNVNLFGYYKDNKKKTTRNAIFDVLKREQADIICFQEFYHTDRLGVFATRDTLTQFLPTKYYHERYTHAMTGRQYFGVALFSRYPIISKGHVPFESDPNNFCIYADVLMHGDTVRIYNAHLQSIRFKPEDYALVDGNRNNEELDDGSKRIARRLKIAFVKREEQVRRMAESIKTCQHEIILCGDFNDTPVSYTYETLTDLLHDSFKEAGNGIGNTYNGVFPSFRIDYIMHSNAYTAVEYETLDEELCDHYAVSIILKRNQAE
ncbi:MAG: endonuclease/exonuclease/phosphatase family protein [Flavobacteriales bacterium]